MAKTNNARRVDGPTLTEREMEILSLVIEGHPSKKVAEKLFISKSTVDFHLHKIYQKLQVSNRIQAIHRARHLGLIPGEHNTRP